MTSEVLETPTLWRFAENMVNGTTVILKIDVSICHVRSGDLVSPDTLIGVEYGSGVAVTAGCNGTVSGVAFGGSEHYLLVMIESNELDTDAAASGQ